MRSAECDAQPSPQARQGTATEFSKTSEAEFSALRDGGGRGVKQLDIATSSVSYPYHLPQGEGWRYSPSLLFILFIASQ